MPPQTLELPRAELSPARQALLDARLGGRTRGTGIVPRAHAAEVPLSFAQERLWFLDRLQQGGTSYNIPDGLRLLGELDPAALERALGEVVRRHGTLRSTFREVEGVPMQAAAPFQGFALPVEDLSSLPEAEREARVRRLAAAEAAHSFSLTAGPLFRARLLRLGAREHVLLLCMHHIVSDGWSMQVLYREMWGVYASWRDGWDSPLPELAVQYADFAVWQREQWSGGDEERHLAYWRGQLAGAPEVLELPADHPRPPLPSFRGERVPVSLTPRVLDRLRELGRAEGATLYMVVLAAFQVLLSRYAGSDDVVVGTPIAGRARREVQELIGLFMNTLVLRTDLSGNPTFRQVVGRVREMTLNAYEHQDVPFERLVAELQPARSLSHTTLFQVMFELENAEDAGDAVPGLRVEGVDAGLGTVKFDLGLSLNAGSRGLTGVLEYSTDLFECGTARRMVEHLERMLEQAAADPDGRLSRLQLMSRTERSRVVEWNRTTSRFPHDRCIHQLFEDQAAATPHAPAVSFAGGELTFRQLDERANRVAHHLRAMGVGPESRVAVCLDRGPGLLAGILGVMKAGGAYVPLDRAYPAERLSYMLGDSGAAVLLTQESLRERAAAPRGVLVVSVDGDAGRIAARPAHAPESGVGSENLAYVIYTSGSTGRPKGVAMHHRGVSNYIHWGIRAYGADQPTGAPVFSSMAVDLTITNLLPLFAGQPVRLLDEDSPVEALARALREKPRYGLIKITPTHLSLLTPLLTPEEARGAARTLVIGADNLVAETTLFWQEHAPGVRLMNEYGPTETVVGCSAYVLPTGKHLAGAVPVGRPIQNMRFYVLDAHLQPVPVALPGELYIGGVGVARGYLGRAAVTAEKFVPDPFAGSGLRMYRTGDRARWLADGNLLFLGRTDNQVKLRGFRVELGEVESVLRRHPSVAACLAVVREDRPGDRRLVAYVVSRGEPAAPAALRGHLRAALPEYMVPDAVVALDALPQTATGKVDPRTLPAPEYGRADGDRDAPRDYTELQLVQIWEELLGISGIGPAQNFFDLGGNSLLALRLFAQVKRRMQCDLPVATLFAGATVRRMAEAVRERTGADAAPESAVVVLQPGGTLPPLWIIHSADREVMGYVSLVRHLGAGQPVFGMRDVGADLARPVPQIAAEHVAALRAVQPHGPYYLAGWSFGGYVAFEMARQLEALGETAAFVGLMDTISPEIVREWPWDGDEDVAVGLAQEVAARMQRPFTMHPHEVAGLDPDEQVRRVVQALHEQGAAPADFAPAALAEQCGIIRDRNRSRATYAPGRLSGTVTLFRASESSERHTDFFARFPADERHTLGWGRHADGVEVHAVPGSHATIAAEPHVHTLVERMQASLARARARVAGPADSAED